MTSSTSGTRSAISLRVSAQRLAQPARPVVHHLRRLGQHGADQTRGRPRPPPAKGTDRFSWSNFPAANAPPADDLLLDLVDQCALADTGGAGNEQQPGTAATRALERRQQRPDLRLAPVQLLGNRQLAGGIAATEREGTEVAAAAQSASALLEVRLQPARALVAILRRLRHQLEDDGGHQLRHRRRQLVRRSRARGRCASAPAPADRWPRTAGAR